MDVQIEEFGDQIRALELVAEMGHPEGIDLPLLIDLNTEEDSITAQNKIWDFFSTLKLVNPRKNFVEVAPSDVKPSDVQPPVKGKNDEF